jgi:hypothetical protein
MLEHRYAPGDIAVAADAAAHGDTSTAIIYYKRALRSLQYYALGNGSNYLERMIENGDMPNPNDDIEAQQWYDQAAEGYLGLLTGADHDKLAADKLYYDVLFDIAIGDAWKGTNRLSDAKTEYQQAESIASTSTDTRMLALKTNIDSKLQALGQ